MAAIESRQGKSAFPYLHIIFGSVVLVAAARYYHVFPVDDGGFFLRYADHIASGLGYQWNPGEPGPIGASAPLWPPLVAMIIKLGVTARVASLVLACVCLFVATILVTTRLEALSGRLASATYVIVFAASANVLGYSVGGLETPLTILVLSSAFYLLASSSKEHGRPSLYLVVAVAALLTITKLDLLPFSLAMLLAARYNPVNRNTLLPSLFGIILLLCYLLFMKTTTGAFLPLSLMRKLQDSAGIGVPAVSAMPRDWFAQNVFLNSGRWCVTVLALFSLPGWFRVQRGVLIFILVGIAGQVAAYTILPPTEAFSWYFGPCLFGMNVLAAGVFLTIGSTRVVPTAAVTAGAIFLGALALDAAESTRLWFIRNSEGTESDRSLAGIWVSTHTPKHFTVFTGWGNPAYYSRRKVYDFSGLNSDFPSGADLIQLHHPEILILCPWQSHTKPSDYHDTPPHYKIVKVFARAVETGQDDFFAIVLAREDVLDQLGPMQAEEIDKLSALAN
jgi:hypothetical protein